MLLAVALLITGPGLWSFSDAETALAGMPCW